MSVTRNHMKREVSVFFRRRRMEEEKEGQSDYTPLEGIQKGENPSDNAEMKATVCLR